MRYAICNETFEGWEHERICRFVAELGYTGLELAPFTLAPLITDLSQTQRQLLRSQADAHGVQLIGLHWLLARTQGLHLTSPDTDVRQNTADYLVELARCCRDLGGSILVFGSPAQRSLLPGISRAQGEALAIDTFRRAQPGIEDAGVTLCLEPLSPPEADFIQTADEAVAILDQIDSPHFLLHLDVKAMATELLPVPELIHRHASRLGHFHANDSNRRGPGFGATDFVPIFRALHEVQYSGWVSVEVFDYSPDPETIARKSIDTMRTADSRARLA
jgi:sugar phosphate isomerase/epimerase